MLGRGRSEYTDVPQHPEEQEYEMRGGSIDWDAEKHGDIAVAKMYSTGTDGDSAKDALLSHQASEGSIDPELNLRGGAGGSERLSQAAVARDNIGYGAAHRDFTRRYKGKVEPPNWDRSTNYQTHYDPIGRNAQTQLARSHNSRKQFLHLLGKIMLRWFCTFLLSVGMVVTFYQYEKIKILDSSAKRWFNAISTGLYVTLGLNMAASLKGMAIIVRWKLLSRKKHKLEEIDFLLGLSSLIKVFRYGIHIAKHRPLTSFTCFMWILFNAVSRLSIVLTGLTYSYDSANAAYAVPGMVNVTNWSNFSEFDAVSHSPISTPEAERHAAHSYGLFSILFEKQVMTKPGESDPNLPLYKPIEFIKDGMWAYFFRDYNPSSISHRNLPHKSNRYVEVSATCSYFPLVRGQYGNSSSVAYQNGTDLHEVKGIPDVGPNATTWINPRGDLNSDWSCGSRCAAVAAIQFISVDSPLSTGSFFDCDVKVSDVKNATAEAHEMPDKSAMVAAGSIGLAGYSIGPDKWEYVRYPPESPWSLANVPPKFSNPDTSNATYAAILASRFALGSIAAKDIYGPTSLQVSQGMLISVGVLLKVKWYYLMLILVGILAIQLALGITAIVWANSVLCKDDSYLSTARLLRPVVERIGDSGCALTGKDIANTMSEEMVYGVKTGSGERHHLDLGADVPVTKRFPNGWYDGNFGMLMSDDETIITSKSNSGSGIAAGRRKKLGLRRRRV